MIEELKMKDVLILRDLEQIKAISHEYRIMIIDAFNDEPCTAKHISDKVKQPHAKVNYHIKTLVKVGILELIEESVKLGIVEKYYAPVAKSFVIDSSVMNTKDKAVMESIKQVDIALFDKIAKEFYNSVELSDLSHSNKMMFESDFYLTNDQARELHNQITATVKDFLKDKGGKSDQTKSYFLGNVLMTKEEI